MQTRPYLAKTRPPVTVLSETKHTPTVSNSNAGGGGAGGGKANKAKRDEDAWQKKQERLNAASEFSAAMPLH